MKFARVILTGMCVAAVVAIVATADLAAQRSGTTDLKVGTGASPAAPADNKPGVTVKTFALDKQLRPSGCTSLLPPPKPELQLFSDGTLHWHIQVTSTEANKTWQGTFEFFDKKDGVSQGTSDAFSYQLKLASHTYSWIQAKPANAALAAKFNAIQYVVFTSHC